MIALAAALLASTAQAEMPPPRVVVMLAIDQMTPEQMHRLAPHFRGGLKRFESAGLCFEKAELEHGDTETAPGHTSYGTGMHPAHHGIIGNDWWPIDSKRTTYCFSDANVHPVRDAGADTGGSVSPKNNRAKALADYVEAANPKSITLALSSKDRSAIGMSGQKPDLALWWSKSRGGFYTSTWYASELPAWVRAWNAGWIGAFRGGEFAQLWKPCFELDSKAFFETSGTAPDERDGEPGAAGERSFPHGVPALSSEPSDKELTRLASWVYDGPCGDVFVIDLACRAALELGLGADDVTDVLMISLSSCDTVGHAYGPTSCEVTDVILRADRELERLFALLDEQAGPERWIASLSADHGVLELPETLRAAGVDAARIPAAEVRAAIDTARAAAAEEFGTDFYLAGGSRGLRLSLAQMREAKVEPDKVRALYAKSLRAAPWVEHALTLDYLRGIAAGKQPAEGLARMEANSFDEERTPDVVLLCKAGRLAGLPFGTTHGTPHPYDRAIPLWFLGPGFPRGKSGERARSVDAVPTLLRRLKLPVPSGLDGRVLVE